MRLYIGLKRNRQFFIWCVLFLLLHTKISAQTIDAGKDTAICIGDSIKLGGKPIVASMSYSFDIDGRRQTGGRKGSRYRNDIQCPMDFGIRF